MRPQVFSQPPGWLWGDQPDAELGTGNRDPDKMERRQRGTQRQSERRGNVQRQCPERSAWGRGVRDGSRDR
jgi:hypothetical protein